MVPTVSRRAALRSVSSFIVFFVVLAGGVIAPSASAATTYSAPLRTAVRQLPVVPEDNAGYDRDRHFGGWIDADGDCRNTRHEVLIAESQVPPTLSASGCSVVEGQWRSFYDGQVYTASSDVDIDHLVPLAEAWGSGARSWTQQQRVAFSNDLGVGYALNAIASAQNSAKSASGPEQWMPPVNQCRYVEIWTSMKHRWQLSVDPDERAALVAHADACPNSTITVSTVLDDASAPTITGPTQTPRGSTTTVTGTAAAGAAVQVFTRKQGQPSFALLRTAVASSAGRWSVPYRADVDQVFHAVTGGVRTPSIVVKALGTTLSAPAAVRRGTTVALRGLARPGARVDVFFRASGTTTFVDRRDLRASSSGAWATTYTATRDHAVFAATAEGRSATRITQAVYATISGPASVRRGSTVTLTGTARPGARVGVYFRPAGTTAYVPRRSLTASAAGTFRTSYVAEVSQAYYAVANGVRSPIRVTDVTAPTPAPPPPSSPPTPPSRPSDRDCGEFSTWAAAQAFFDTYYPHYGDVSGLDADGDRIACESLPGAP